MIQSFFLAFQFSKRHKGDSIVLLYVCLDQPNATEDPQCAERHCRQLGVLATSPADPPHTSHHHLSTSRTRVSDVSCQTQKKS